jgi:hypothetical protein
MRSQTSQSRGLARGLVVLCLVLAVLAACGGPEPAPQVIVVTSTFTPEPVVQIVTATPSPTPEIVPSDTPLPEPSDTPLPPPIDTPEAAPLEFITYDHPSGAFSLDIPPGADVSEDETGLYLTYSDSLLMVFFSSPDTPLDATALDLAVPMVLDQALVGEGLISSYDGLETEGNDAGDSISASFGMTSDLFGDGTGNLILWQVGPTLYFVILLTPDQAEVQEVWQTAVDTLTVTPLEPTPLPEPPTSTPVPPTPTRKPTPKPTKAPPPTSAPAPASNQGCYLFDNQLDAELTVTFTAQDWQWSDSFRVPANGTKEYCLDPGHYTYTIDAPPPWNSINGDLQVNPGDLYSWPIHGG